MVMVAESPKNAGMGRRKKSTDKPATKQADRHREGYFMVRLPPEFAPLIDAQVALRPGSDRTEWVRNAVLEQLQRLGVWPPPQAN